ncbi:hypothetical protein ZWY2020_050604 [Hordeum vulgare]|nr:hypothetical protein ZWY2020_050604 [Hordeum vulgare]
MAVPSSSSLLSLLLLLLLLALPHHRSAAQDHGAAAVNISAVEAAVRDRAFQLLHRTDKLVGVPLTACAPACGVVTVQASVLRVRSSSLLSDGVNATAPDTAGFIVPPRVVPAPFARRVDVVFERFVGNASATLFAAPRGYALAAPVAALLAYDVSAGNNGSRAVSLRALGAPVRVDFGDLASMAAAANGPSPLNTMAAKCVTFTVDSGNAVATHAMTSATACAVTGTGHYGVEVRLQPPPPPPTPLPPPPPPAAVRGRWWAWTVVAGLGGVVAVSFLAVTVAAAVRWSRRRRREDMDMRALAREELGRMTVRGSRMAAAKMVRTRPELEDGSPLAWRR